MADAFYTDLRDNTADPLIKEFGKPMTLVLKSGGTYSGATGKITVAESETEYPCTGVQVSFKKSEMGSGDVKMGDVKVLLSATGLDVVPDSSYRLKIGDEVYTVVNCDPLRPGGVDVIYEMHVRI